MASYSRTYSTVAALLAAAFATGITVADADARERKRGSKVERQAAKVKKGKKKVRVAATKRTGKSKKSKSKSLRIVIAPPKVKRRFPAESRVLVHRRRALCLPRVRARGVARGFGPHFVKRHRARRKAIRNWRGKVANHYGFRFDRWRRARAKDVFCKPKARGVVCKVSAAPCRGKRFAIY